MFCARPEDSTWRYLFEFDPDTKALVQLSHEDTYNGQYIQNGRGYAYVGNPNNSFYLAVRPEDPEEHVDLFTQGSVVSYAASPDGNRLYVHAAQGDEPHGIWEYDLTTKQLRPISGVMQQPFEAAEVIAPEELRITSFDGKEIPAYFFTPPMALQSAKEEGGFFERRMKYPAVIYIPPNSAQMQRSYGPRSQLLANIGFYFLAVNYRGVDGYGRDYANSYDPPTAAKDILAAYDWLIENPNINRNNIFIFSMSGGTPICRELLATEPDLWRGIAIDKPGSLSIDPRFIPRKMPKLFLITGGEDPAMPSVRRFADWAEKNDVDLQLEIYEDAAHITFDLESRKRSQKEVAEFYIRNVK